MMTSACADSTSINTLAFTQAIHNLAENRWALAESQNQLNVGEIPRDVEWVFARDRALTYRDAEGTWFTGCSLPRRAAAEMMRRLEIAGPVACFLVPSHAAQLRVALDRLRPEQAIIAIIPDDSALPAILACHPFGDDIARHRLWIVAGENWADDLRKLFRDVPGLCTPTQFIRLPILEEAQVEQLIPAAQRAFSDVATERAVQIREYRERVSPRSSRICLVGGTNFRLWDDAPSALVEILSPHNPLHVDLDDPARASTLALAQTAPECCAIVAANIGRSDLQNLVSDARPWITWASDLRIPSAHGAREHDRIITAYPKLAQRAGWGNQQIIAATWALQASSTKPDPSGSGSSSLAIILDTKPLDVPDYLSEYSSHRVLWEMIDAELRDNPFILTDDIEGFVHRRMRKLDISPENFPMQRFAGELLLPTYQQSLAQLLVRNRISIRLFGKGWDRIRQFAASACGAVESRQHLRDIATAHTALVHVWIDLGPHAIDSLGKPVLRRRSNLASTFINDAKQLLTGGAVSAPFSLPQLSAEMILKLVA